MTRLMRTSLTEGVRDVGVNRALKINKIKINKNTSQSVSEPFKIYLPVLPDKSTSVSSFDNPMPSKTL